VNVLLANKIYLGIAALLAAGMAYFGWQLHSARAAARDNAFRADSVAAALDTTRVVNARAQKVLGDSLRGVELRAVQLVSLKVDALDQALRRISAARFNTTTTIRSIDSVQATAKVAVSPQDVRSALFEVDSAPYHVRAAVSLPAPPAPGRIGISVRTDTARLSYRVQCGKAKADGIRPASVEISGPPWLSTTISDAQTEQNVCNAQQNPSHWLRWLLIGVGTGVAADHFLTR
jgi:hypothetical protein